MCPVYFVTHVPGLHPLLTRCQISTACFDAIGNPYSGLAAWRLGGSILREPLARGTGRCFEVRCWIPGAHSLERTVGIRTKESRGRRAALGARCGSCG